MEGTNRMREEEDGRTKRIRGGKDGEIHDGGRKRVERNMIGGGK